MALVATDINSASMLVTCYNALGDSQAARRVAQIALSRAEKILTSDQNNGEAIGYGASALAALAPSLRPVFGPSPGMTTSLNDNRTVGQTPVPNLSIESCFILGYRRLNWPSSPKIHGFYGPWMPQQSDNCFMLLHV